MLNFLRAKYRGLRDLIRSKYRFFPDSGLPDMTTRRDRELEIIAENKNHPAFDFSVYLSQSTCLGRLAGRALRWFSWLARKTGWVNFRILPYKILARSADVKAAFADDTNFKVPFGPEMKAIAGPVTFGLGLDNDEHKMQRAVMIMYMSHDRQMKGADSWASLGQTAGYVLDDCGGRIDVMSEFAIPLISEACLDRFGLQCPDPVAFAQWNIAVSIQLFASPSGSTDLKLQQLAAASRNIRNCIEYSMHASTPPSKDTLLGYLLHLRKQDRFPEVSDASVSVLLAGTSPAEYLSDDRIIAIVAGMVSGFVPTTSLGSGNLITVLSERPEAMAALSAAAAANDRTGVRDIILEAARFAPAGDPGHFRIVAQDYLFKRNGVKIHQFRKNDLVLLSTPQAMRDPKARKNPKAFIPGQKACPNYMFGHDHHSCVGREMATEVMTELFLQLFSRPEIKLKSNKHVIQAGPFPWSRELRFKPNTPVTQSMITIGVPLKQGAKAAVEDLLASPAYRVPATVSGKAAEPCVDIRKAGIADVFQSIALIHNASMCVVDLTCYGEAEPTLLIEFNIDGDGEGLFKAFDEIKSNSLQQLIDSMGYPDKTPGQVFRDHVANLAQRPWGDIGLGFNGVGDFPVQQIELERKLYLLLQPLVQGVVSSSHWSSGMAYWLLAELRAIIRGNKSPEALIAKLKACSGAEQCQSCVSALDELQGMAPALARPAHRVPNIADYAEKGFTTALRAFLLQPKTLVYLTSIIWLPLIIAFNYALIKYCSLYPVLISTLKWTVIFALVVTGIYVVRWFLRRRIQGGLKTKPVESKDAPQSLKDCLLQEKVRSYLKFAVILPLLLSFVCSVLVHSPVLAVVGSTLALTGALAFAFVLVAAMVIALLASRLRSKENADSVDENLVRPDDVQRIQDNENRPDLIQNQLTAVNTLKKGRYRLALLALGLLVIKLEVLHWFRSGFVVDIGTIRHAKWFRLKGTDQLIFQANFDGSWESYLEDFSNKAYQGQNAVWSHCEGYPRTRFMTGEGARDGDNFKRWVRSKQVTTHFWYNRFPDLSNAHIRRNAMVRDGLARAGTATEAKAWLSYFGSQPGNDNCIEDDEIQSLVFNANKRLQYSAYIGLRFNGDANDIAELKKRQAFLQAVLAGHEVSDQMGQGRAPVPGFGDRIRKSGALYIAFSHHGLRCMGLQDSDQNFGLSSFSPAFVNGMANRHAILGDSGQQHPDNWSWSDATTDSSDAIRVDVVLFTLANEHSVLEENIARLSVLWGDCAAEVVQCRTGRSVNDDKDYQPGRVLGFRDGISQPVIRGTYRHSARPSVANDVMEPGEVILGYRDNKGYFPLTPKVEAAQDSCNQLPDLPAQSPGLYVSFGTSSTQPRDVGRNGTYLALRQIEIDSKGFKNQLSLQNKETGIPEATISAKIMGRWPSGAPLVRYPDADPYANREQDVPAHELNDFLYGGSEDPQGNRCPLGAHIRRANPRDSLGAIAETELKISNRHRILRRGRTYHKVWFNGDKSQVQQMDSRPQQEGGNNQSRGTEDVHSTGLLFVAMNANLERQFEFVQQTWINGKSFHGLDDKADPILGAVESDQFSIPSANGTVVLQNLQSYSRVRGGGYYFMPGLSFLRYLAGNA